MTNPLTAQQLLGIAMYINKVHPHVSVRGMALIIKLSLQPNYTMMKTDLSEYLSGERDNSSVDSHIHRLASCGIVKLRKVSHQGIGQYNLIEIRLDREFVAQLPA